MRPHLTLLYEYKKIKNKQWPAGRCAFRMVRRPNGNILLASDGLSDPFDDLTLGEFCQRKMERGGWKRALCFPLDGRRLPRRGTRGEGAEKRLESIPFAPLPLSLERRRFSTSPSSSHFLFLTRFPPPPPTPPPPNTHTHKRTHQNQTGDGNVNGFGLEFYIEAPASEFGDAADAAASGFGGPSTASPSASSGSGPTLHAAKASWQFQLLYTVAQLAAGHGGIRAIMDEMRLLSTEAEGVAGAMPAEAASPPPSASAVVTPAGRVGALLGLRADALAGGAESDGRAPPPPDRIPSMPLTDVLLVNVKLLTLGELGLITERGAQGRAALDAAFRGAGRLVSSLTRPSVV